VICPLFSQIDDQHMTMTFEEVKACLDQRFPFIMVDRVLELEPGKSITAIKNVTGNEIQFLGHFPSIAIMPGVFMVEAVGQCAAILFKQTAQLGERDLLVLGAIHDMKFLAPVYPGHTMEMKVTILQTMGAAALVEGSVLVEGTVVAKGRLSFAKSRL
jgi:3-hydroxyacyl-[acyl-carrier-protein] dehydratase